MTYTRRYLVEVRNPKGPGVYTVGEFLAQNPSQAIEAAKAKLAAMGNRDMILWDFKAIR